MPCVGASEGRYNEIEREWGGAKCPSKLLVSFAVMSAVVVLASSACIVSDADVEASTETIDFDEFLTRLAAADYDYDGKGVTVDWKSVSGCWAGGPDGQHGPHKHLDVGLANGNTPKRVDTHRYQYQICSGETDVKISNVNFKFTVAAASICINSDWYFDASTNPEMNNIKGAELQFLNSGSLTISNCSFDSIGISPFSVKTSVSLVDCQFKNVWDNYALKFVKAQSIKVSGCEFNNVGCPILIGNWESNTSATVKSIEIVDNNFVDIDVPATGGDYTHGLVKLEGACNDAYMSYSGATFKIRGNILSFTDSTADSFGVIRVCTDVPTGTIVEEVVAQNDFSMFPFVNNYTSTIYIDPTGGSDLNNGKSSTTAVQTLDKAISLASGSLFVNLCFVGGGEISSTTSITQIVSMDLNGYKVTLKSASIDGGHLAVSSGVLYVDDDTLRSQVLGTAIKTPSQSAETVEVESDTAKTVAEKTGETTAIVSEITATDETNVSQAIVEAAKQISTVKTVMEATENVTVQVVVPVTESTQKIEVSNAAMTALKDSGAELKVTNNDTAVSLDNEVLQTMSSKSVTVEIAVTPDPDSSMLTPVQESLIGSNQSVDVSAYAGGEKISNLGGTATISVPYTAGGSVKVTYISDDGATEIIPSTYSDGVVTFTTTHFSVYMISSSFSPGTDVPDDDDDYYPIYYPDQSTSASASDDSVKIAIVAGAVAVVLAAIALIAFRNE